MSEKIRWKPGTMIYPLPAVMVTCGSTKEDFNIITIAWTGTVCTEPPMCYISVRPSRHSYSLIKNNGEFVINLTSRDLARHTDWCGVKSGKNVNKFKETGLTPIAGDIVKAPLIKEAPINIECIVKDILELGVHHMFLAEVVAIHAEPAYMDKESGEFDLNRANMISYSHGKYYETGKFVGKFGFSVKKNKKKSASRKS